MGSPTDKQDSAVGIWDFDGGTPNPTRQFGNLGGIGIGEPQYEIAVRRERLFGPIGQLAMHPKGASDDPIEVSFR